MTIPQERTSSTFQLATTPTIGSYLLPGYHLENISEQLNTKIKVNINTYQEIIEGIKNKTYNMGLIENPIFDKNLTHLKWIQNELVICSNIPLPPQVDKKFLKKCTLICREKSSETRKLVNHFFTKMQIQENDFKAIKEINHITATIQSVKWSKPQKDSPILSIISKFAIEEELNNKTLFTTSFQNYKMIHDYYIVYSNDSTYKNIIHQLSHTFQVQE